MSGHITGKIVTAVVGLALVGAAVYLATIGRQAHVSTLIAAGLAILGAVGTLALPRVGERREPRQ